MAETTIVRVASKSEPGKYRYVDITDPHNMKCSFKWCRKRATCRHRDLCRCVKCRGEGCDRCGGTGLTTFAPTEYHRGGRS